MGTVESDRAEPHVLLRPFLETRHMPLFCSGMKMLVGVVTKCSAFQKAMALDFMK